MCFVALFADPSERVALQLSLLITNIARFDFPGRSENLLQVRGWAEREALYARYCMRDGRMLTCGMACS